MSEYTIWHNPRCSKSRQTLAILNDEKPVVNIREYLKDSPNAKEIKEVVGKLGISPRELLRTKEEPYKELSLGDGSKSDDDIINAMVENPVLIERPIVIKDNQAVIGRPPENVKELF